MVLTAKALTTHKSVIVKHHDVQIMHCCHLQLTAWHKCAITCVVVIIVIGIKHLPQGQQLKCTNIRSNSTDTDIDWVFVDHRLIPVKYFVKLHPISIDVSISRVLKQNGYWDLATTFFLSNKLKNCKSCVFIDIGANIGYFTLLAAKLGINVYAFEPNSLNLNALHLSISKNQLTKQITLFPLGLSDRDDEFLLQLLYGNNLGTGELSENMTTNYNCIVNCELNYTHRQEIIRTTTLDNLIYLIKHKTVVIKMDVQSHECYVVRGGKQFLKENDVQYITMEIYFGTGVSRHKNLTCFTDMVNILLNFCYDLKNPDGTNLQLDKFISLANTSFVASDLLLDFNVVWEKNASKKNCKENIVMPMLNFDKT